VWRRLSADPIERQLDRHANRGAWGVRLAPPMSINLAPPILLILALAACATSSRAVQGFRWDRAQTTEEAFANDRHHCLRGATQSGVIVGRPHVDPERFAACMAMRGYTRSDAGQFGPPAEKASGGR